MRSSNGGGEEESNLIGKDAIVVVGPAVDHPIEAVQLVVPQLALPLQVVRLRLQRTHP